MAALTHPRTGKTVIAIGDLEEFMRARGWIDTAPTGEVDTAPSDGAPAARATPKRSPKRGETDAAESVTSDGDAAATGADTAGV